jgi:hypothetical protein
MDFRKVHGDDPELIRDSFTKNVIFNTSVFGILDVTSVKFLRSE